MADIKKKCGKNFMGHNDLHETYEMKLPDELQMYERKIYNLKTLIDLGMSLSSNLEFESLVETILYSCIGQLFVEKIAILLQEDIDINSFYVHMSKGCDEKAADSIMLTEGSPLIEYLTANPKVIDINRLCSIKGIENDCEVLAPLEPVLLVPMKSKNSLNGIIILGDKITGDGFSDYEKDFLQDLAKFAAIAVENSRLYRMATLDRMTRLYIHHYFQERLKEEVARSDRAVSPLSFIILDIDHFKKFNDTYGHQQGDSVLKETAALISKNIRLMDVPARYGGEEFAIILPDTNLQEAIEVATRLRKSVESHQFPSDKGMLSVTISVGVAQYDNKLDNDTASIIKRADTALYKAKQSGRNKVVAHRIIKKSV